MSTAAARCAAHRSLTLMKKGIVIRAFSGNTDFLGSAGFLSDLGQFEHAFDRAARLGFEGVQPYVEPEGFFSLAADESTHRLVAAAARRAGVTLTSLEIKPFSYLWTADDPDVRAAGVETVHRAMRIAAVMEIPAVLVIPGYVGLPWDSSVKPIRYDLAYERTREALTELAPTAERLGVSILMENIWNKFLLSPLEMRSLIDEVGSRRVGVLLDTGNLIAFGYPEQWIRILGHRIGELHLKDYRAAVGGVEGFVDLFQGDVNWPEVTATLCEIGYEGFLTAEVFPDARQGDETLCRTSASMDRILGRV
jgi:hexulose-6-phosphate isomerase